MINTKTLNLALILAAATALPSAAQAKDCYVLVHGNMSTNAAENPADVLPYWTKYGDFAGRITNKGAANYAIVKWNAKNADAVAYWEPAAAGAVLIQLLTIQSGGGDGLSHAYQCTASDRFFVVAHSQGAQIMTFINGNAYATAPYYNTVINEREPTSFDDSDLIRDMPFDQAMAKVTAVFTIGGAINGTQGMDRACAGGAATELLALFGNFCVRSMTTPAIYNPRSNTGDKLLRPMYSLGGYRSYFYTELLLNGEDDGIINLRSQMNCQGSATESIDKYLKSGSFTCDSSHKRHSTNSFNLASIFINHDYERGASTGSFSRATSASAGLMSCGGSSDMAGTIRACLSRVAP